MSLFAVLTLGMGCLDLDDGRYRFPCVGAECQADAGPGLPPGRDGGARDGGLETCTVTCTAPARYCGDPQTLVTPRVRACTGASCQFESTSVPCSQGCAAGACVGNPCAGKTCTLPPATSCEGNVLKTSRAPGVCDGATGTCTYERIDTVCAAGCANAACVSDPCGGVACNTPPAPTCVSPTLRQYFNTTGVCQTGTCSYVPMTETCMSGSQCQGGQCVTAPPSCSASNCSGCCMGTTCVGLGNQSSTTCGSEGSICMACKAGNACISGACVDVNECLTNNGGCHANAICTNTTGSRTCQCKPGYFGDGLTCAPIADGGVPGWVNVRDGGSSFDPEPRRGAMMAFDAARSETVLFGGYDGVKHFDDTWTWNGSTWQWKNSSGPSARRLAAVAYDSFRKKVVLFGGYSGTSVLADTWEWSGSGWTQRLPLNSPTARNGAGAAYDSARKRMVIFGGRDTVSADLDETWEWDGTNWEQRLPAAKPSGRFSPAMTFDSGRNVIVLFGGTGVTRSNETWEYTGTNWSLRSSDGPTPRYAATIGFLGGRTVLYGGFGFNFVMTDTWEWNGSFWTARTRTLNDPGARFYPGGAVDLARQKLVLFGGDGTDAYLRDTWVYGP